MSKTSDKILDIAENLFNRQSYDSVGVDLIRDVSGASKTTMYRHFHSKNDLIYAVLKRRDERFLLSLENYVQQADVSAEAKISAIFEWHFQWFSRDDFAGCMFLKSSLNNTKNIEEINALAIAHKNRVYKIIEDALLGSNQLGVLVELVFNSIEGLIARFSVTGFDKNIAQNTLKDILYLQNILALNH